MKLDTSPDSLPVYEALASGVRLKVLELVREREMSIKELAQACGLSSAIMSMHAGKLEKAGLITSVMKRVNGGTSKYCRLAVAQLQVELSPSAADARRVYETSVPIGHYTSFEVEPTCGMATKDSLIGRYDDPRYFFEPERVNADILWFAKGFVEYKIPNYLHRSQRLLEIEITLELGSEAPYVNENWPSDIRFSLNGQSMGSWTSPGDYGLRRGKYTPDWWQADVNQYGLLKQVRINEAGTFIDGNLISTLTTESLETNPNHWTLRLEAGESGSDRHAGGLTLFGRGFGDYDQDILFKVYYE
jgi:predicted transcriptional regulator